ncbi:LacI family transcriptional regulator/LacI family transcriptional regulator, repressor for deo operon, udp, cdd, tsx, nupC, and nupG [Saccharopolyspora antimicrobica]|uniref:LacI family transcriptional regulator n=1 Tax=Saccharopolyspora antimicrobica TaxID=455193 RepID=A0A1I5JXF4_9PSEU|nr:LacI family DNA-binding transcriptional regulator [Saccharopolyspora antimicrobica]RKT86970.1 LacI family transcriptional regulator [Saccharopolyspora antimicrobica]SFO77026.1 LacI family transcriptional regulator/LacI family transcriptional regulator, repressor for deo operon, udp, cdd, tsx, nupC, and nupG [Saccharopolyspora antimicrobica]
MTLTRVAQRAQVSTSTASRYLRGQLKVQPETAARIDAAVRELHYEVRPAATADGAREHAPVIALIVPELANPFFAALAEEIATAAAVSGASLVIGVTGRQAQREAKVSDFVAGTEDIDGMIYVGMHRENPRLLQAIADGLPVVVLDEEIANTTGVDTIGVDNYGGAYQATAYLAQLGHRRIAHIAGPRELSTTRDRLRGYRDAMEHAGLDVDEDLILHGPYTEQFGASTFPYLTGAAQPPTAVFIGSDIAAVGVLGAAELHGLSIPEDLSVVGCDGIRVGEWLRPKLTTLQQPVAELARGALELVHARITDPGGGTVRRNLPLQLVIRGSAVPPQH